MRIVDGILDAGVTGGNGSWVRDCPVQAIDCWRHSSRAAMNPRLRLGRRSGLPQAKLRCRRRGDLKRNVRRRGRRGTSV